MTMTSTRYDFGQCTVEHVDRAADGIVIRVAQTDRQGEAIFTLNPVEVADLCERASDLLLPDTLIHAQLSGQELGA